MKIRLFQIMSVSLAIIAQRNKFLNVEKASKQKIGNKWYR